MSVEKESVDTTWIEKRLENLERKFRVLMGLLKDKKIIGKEIIIETINKPSEIELNEQIIKWYLEKELNEDTL